MASIVERLAAVETILESLSERLDSLDAEITTGEGLSPRRSVRSRLHQLESDNAAKSAAEAALSALKAERRADRNSRLTKINIIVAACSIFGVPLMTHFLR